MSSKDLKTEQERIIELYIKEYITETEYYVMYNRIKKGVGKDGENVQV